MQKFTKKPNKADIPDVDFYILKYDTEKQRRLLTIRAAARDKQPDSTERIFYGIPTVELDGKVILQYAAYKKHISLLVGNLLPKLLKEKYPDYQFTDYTVVFPDNQPLPVDFIEEICGLLGQLTGEDYYAKNSHKN